MMVILLLCLLLILVLIVALPPFRPVARQLWVVAALLARLVPPQAGPAPHQALMRVTPDA
jgi:hypothetical protein